MLGQSSFRAKGVLSAGNCGRLPALRSRRTIWGLPLPLLHWYWLRTPIQDSDRQSIEHDGAGCALSGQLHGDRLRPSVARERDLVVAEEPSANEGAVRCGCGVESGPPFAEDEVAVGPADGCQVPVFVEQVDVAVPAVLPDVGLPEAPIG